MKYTAITIGPIYKTFQSVKKTRELWAASFCFSFLMKNIRDQLTSKGIKAKDFILPYFEESKQNREYEQKGIGLFPDRLIFRTEKGGLDQLIPAINYAFDALSEEISQVISKDTNIVLEFIKNYFQISYIEKSIQGKKDAENIILALSPYLDTLEQQNKFLPKEPIPNYLFQFFNQVNKRKNKSSFLAKYFEIQDINENFRVESLIEIATWELRGKTHYKKHVNNLLWDKTRGIDKDVTKQKSKKKANDTTFLEALIEECKIKNTEKKNNPFNSYHKYYCILQADGDKIGATLKTLRADEQVREFSNHLINWALETYKEIKNYHGVPIYIGGDDLLCIVPVSNGKQNVFDLIRNIDTIFNEEFPGAIPTLSFGLSITYYKYPLAEAFEKAYNLLEKAKEAGGNRIAAQIIKHSGGELISIFDKSSVLYNQSLFNLLKVLDNEEASNSSITYKLRENEKTLEQIGLKPERVTQFINHLTGSKAQINDNYDDLSDKEKFMRLIKDAIIGFYKQKANEVIKLNMADISEGAMKEIYSMLRIVKFVKGLDDDKQ